MSARALRDAILLGVLGTIIPGIPAIADCGLVTKIPTFTETIDAGTTPELPVEPLCHVKLESFRINVELYRENVVEGYNNYLKYFLAELNEISEKIEYSFARKPDTCPEEEYNRLKDNVKSEFRKARQSYLEPYRRGMNIYRHLMLWYKETKDYLEVRRKLHGSTSCG